MDTDWLKDASPEALRAALISMAETYKLNADEIKTFVTGKPSTQKQKLIDIVHTAFCIKGHSGEPLPCAYHLEESTVDPFMMPTHLEWALKTNALLARLEIAESLLMVDISIAFKTLGEWSGTIVPILLSAMIELERPVIKNKIAMIKNIMTGKEEE